jgi:hypothetical protein
MLGLLVVRREEMCCVKSWMARAMAEVNRSSKISGSLRDMR